MVVVKIPSLKSKLLFCKLSKGMGHNLYGEPAWPNDILYIFPVVILLVIGLIVLLTVLEPYSVAVLVNIFATPLEILFEWYFLSTFNLIRVLPDKFIGVISCLSVPAILFVIIFLENLNVYQNPFRRSIAVSVFLSSLFYFIWLGIGGLLFISLSLPLLL